MKQRRVVTTPEADEDARRIDEWWSQHRGAAPNLFVEELADALALVGMEVGVGVVCAQRAIPGLRRYLLRATRFHVYFVHSDEMVVVLGIWGAMRGVTPRFAARAASASAAFASPAGGTTVVGFVNRNRQEVIRDTGLPGSDHLQRVYELQCHDCGLRYGSNGSDNFQRKCPRCQDGADGLPLS
jgi:hypothetical protein